MNQIPNVTNDPSAHEQQGQPQTSPRLPSRAQREYLLKSGFKFSKEAEEYFRFSDAREAIEREAPVIFAALTRLQDSEAAARDRRRAGLVTYSTESPGALDDHLVVVDAAEFGSLPFYLDDHHDEMERRSLVFRNPGLGPLVHFIRRADAEAALSRSRTKSLPGVHIDHIPSDLLGALASAGRELNALNGSGFEQQDAFTEKQMYATHLLQLAGAAVRSCASVDVLSRWLEHVSSSGELHYSAFAKLVRRRLDELGACPGDAEAEAP
jgi:hypothetical protein